MKQYLKSLVVLPLWAGLFAACQTGDKKLPIMGERDWVEKTIDGKTVVDTIYHTIPGFSFINQFGQQITDKDVANKIYIADFFFTSCPTICPVMKKNMLKVYKSIQNDDEVAILSHTIDPSHDTPEVLLKYTEDLGVTGNQWLFLTGEKPAIYGIAQKGYFIAANEDEKAAGGFIHSGAFTLVDKEKRVRGVYDGTDEKGVKKLIEDIATLKKEYESGD